MSRGVQGLAFLVATALLAICAQNTQARATIEMGKIHGVFIT